MAIDLKRVAELKAEELGKFSGETKITTERHKVYSINVDITNEDAPKLIVNSRNEVTPPSGVVIPGESEQTIVALEVNAEPFQQTSPRGLPTGKMATVGDMLASTIGLAVDAVAAKKARERAEKEAAENPPPQGLEG